MMTDVGMVRDHNEDSAYVDTGSDFFVVADGMGGHAAGEVASAMAVATVRQALEDARPTIKNFAIAPSDEGRKELVSVLESAVRQAHQAVYERGVSESDKQGMGTTLDVVMLAGPEAFVAHVGDSRTYLVRDGKAAQITTDHTVAEVLVIEGKLSLEEAQISPLRTILVNAIGVAPDVGVEMAHVRLRTGDQLLLCSDGLHDYFPMEQELADHLSGSKPDKALAEMVDIAKNRGGHDNITGVIVEVLNAPEEAAGASSATGLESTQQMAAISDGVPDSVARDDTMPVDDSDETSGFEDTLRPRGPDEATVEAPAFNDDELAEGKRGSSTEDGEVDMTETVRLKPLENKGDKAKPKAKTSKKSSKKSGKSKKDKGAATDSGEASNKSKSKKRRGSKKVGSGDVGSADTMPPYKNKSDPAPVTDDSDDTPAKID